MNFSIYILNFYLSNENPQHFEELLFILNATLVTILIQSSRIKSVFDLQQTNVHWKIDRNYPTPLKSIQKIIFDH